MFLWVYDFYWNFLRETSIAVVFNMVEPFINFTSFAMTDMTESLFIGQKSQLLQLKSTVQTKPASTANIEPLSHLEPQAEPLHVSYLDWIRMMLLLTYVDTIQVSFCIVLSQRVFLIDSLTKCFPSWCRVILYIPKFGTLMSLV